jgi:AP-1 complex subunit gamma-1
VYALVNEGNIKTLTKELLDYLKISDLEFKPDLTNKICMLVQRFAPDKRWHLDSLLQVTAAQLSPMLLHADCCT